MTAARFWRWWVAGQVLMAAALGIWGAQLIAPSRSGERVAVALLTGLALLLIVPALFLAASFAGAIACTSDPKLSWSYLTGAARALGLEYGAFARTLGVLMRAAPAPAPAAATAPRAESRTATGGGGALRPLLLVHGVLCNHAIWNDWEELLHGAGFAPIRAVDLEPLLGDVETHAAQVAQEISALQRRCAGARVAILAHSRGGLVARAALRRLGPQSIRVIVTLATPHHGTIYARLYPGRAAAELRPHSHFLRELLASAAGTALCPIVSIFTPQDNLVVPGWSAILDETRAVGIAGVGHLRLLRDARARLQALAALGAAAER